jgi:hypothetical protein
MLAEHVVHDVRMLGEDADAGEEHDPQLKVPFEDHDRDVTFAD